MTNSERKQAGVDLSNVSVPVCGLAAKYWLMYFMVVQMILGATNLVFFINRVHEDSKTSSGLLNLICVVLLLCSLLSQSKTVFTIVTVIIGIDACTECYLLFTRILLAVEVSSPYYSDYLILILFSIVRVFFSSLFTVVLMRLSWCNGLPDEDDLEKRAIYECIEEMGVFKCEKCSESEEHDD